MIEATTERRFGWTKWMPLLAVVVALAASLGTHRYKAQTASTTWTVHSTADSDSGSCGSNCTLREAIKYSAAGDTVVFDGTAFASAQTITVGSELAITHNLTITGPGANVLTVSGNNSVRVFHITTSTVALAGLTIANGHLFGNSGAGIQNDGGTLAITACTFDSNAGEEGGAIMNNGNSGNASLTVTGCTFNNNSSSVNGGAIYNNGYNGAATMSATNCTFKSNDTRYYGGALYNNQNATMTLVNCTLSANTAGNAGGGINQGGTSVSLRNTILANTSNFNGVATSLGHNISSDSSGPNGATDLLNTNAKLDTNGLQYNGGSTKTIKLQDTSPAIDAGDDAVLTSNGGTLDYDQRGSGYPRQRGRHVDIGAYEVQNQAPVATAQSVSTIINTNKTITLAGVDADDDTLAFKVTSLPVQGNLYQGADTTGHHIVADDLPYTLTGNQVTFAPATDYMGDDSFTFMVNDGTVDSVAGATVSITVTEAPSLVVTTTSDSSTNADGKTSLREAIAYANSGNAGATPVISFDSTIFAPGSMHTITLARVELTIGHDLTITGPGDTTLTVNGNHAIGIFHITGGTVAISGLSIADGHGGLGGGIYNDGSLTVTNSTLSGNLAFEGGGIYNSRNLTVSNCTLSGNNGNDGGGGIYSTGTLTVANSTFSSNDGFDGGGIYNRGTLTVTNSTFSGNDAQAAHGGGIHNRGALTVTNSTFSGNKANGAGGAICNSDGTLNILNTLLAASTGFNLVKLSGDVNSLGHNLSDDAAGGDAGTGPDGDLNGPGDIRNTDPLLDINGLQPNGGPTKTIKLQASSPAIDAGDDAVTGAPLNLLADQRGASFARKVGAHVDIGAFEREVNHAPGVAGQQLLLIHDTSKTVTLTGSDADSDALTFKIISLPVNGKLYAGIDNTGHEITAAEATARYALPGNKVTYVPNAAFVGDNNFDFVASDGALESAAAKIKLKITGSLPTGSVTTPANSAVLVTNGLTAINGDATDNSGTGIKKVTLSLYYFSGGVAQFWNGTTWVGANTLLPVALDTPAGNVTPWHTTAMLPTSLPPGAYTLRIEVVDNTSGSSGYITSGFKVTSSPPTGAITTPANNAVLTQSGLTGIGGSATDNSGVGIKKVNLSLYYFSGGVAQFWNGSAWVTTSSLLPVTLDGTTGNVTQWHTTATLPASLPLGAYTLRFEVVDNVPKSSGLLYNNFTVKQPASLSAAGAKAFSGTIKLYFTGPLDATTSQNIANYTVSVGGTPLTVQGASYSSNVVTLQMGAYAYSLGDVLHVTWSGIQDANGLTVSGSTDITAR